MAIAKNKLFLLIALVAIVVVGGAAVGLLLSKIIKLPQVIQTAKISYVEGTVEFRDGDNVWQDAERNQKLDLGASVKTSEGLAIIDFEDGSQVRLNTQSQVTLTTLESKHYLITNDKGDVYARVTKSKDRVFEVKVGEATYQAQGTAFRTFCTDDKKGIEVYESKVNIIGVDKNNKILVEQGKKYYLVFKDDKTQEMKVTEINKDELKKDEFLIWNKAQDELVREFKENLGLLFDINPPKLEITAPTGDVEEGVTSVDVVGFTEIGAKVTVNGAPIAVDSEGRFSSKYTVKAGDVVIKIEAVDSAGNAAFKKIYIKKKKATPVSTKTVAPTVSGTPGAPTKTSTAKPTDTPKPGEPTNTAQQVQPGIEITGISIVAGPQSLTVQPYYKKVTLGVSFRLVGGLTASAYKIVAGTSPAPRYGSAPYATYVSGGSTYGEVQVDALGGTIYVSVGRYPEKDIYSSDATVTVPLATYPPTDTPTLIPPTDTPVPPTATPTMPS